MCIYAYLYTIFDWLVVNACPDVSPGAPSKESRAGQNRCQRNVVKCILEWTVCGKVFTKVKRHSNRKTTMSFDFAKLKNISIAYHRVGGADIHTIWFPPVCCRCIASRGWPRWNMQLPRFLCRPFRRCFLNFCASVVVVEFPDIPRLKRNYRMDNYTMEIGVTIQYMFQICITDDFWNIDFSLSLSMNLPKNVQKAVSVWEAAAWAAALTGWVPVS